VGHGSLRSSWFLLTLILNYHPQPRNWSGKEGILLRFRGLEGEGLWWGWNGDRLAVLAVAVVNWVQPAVWASSNS
jgi:hypothetical protein